MIIILLQKGNRFEENFSLTSSLLWEYRLLYRPKNKPQCYCGSNKVAIKNVAGTQEKKKDAS